MRILTTLTLAIAVAACGSTGFGGADATTAVDAVGDPEVDDMVEEDCPSPFVEGPCDLNIGDFDADRVFGAYHTGWWAEAGDWDVDGILEDVPCGSQSILYIKSLGRFDDPPEDPLVGPKEAGVYEVANWVEEDTCGLCIWYFEDGTRMDNSTRTFRASTGTLDIEELVMHLETGSYGYLRGTLLDTVFEEWDWEAREPVSGGASLCIERWHFDTELVVPL